MPSIKNTDDPARTGVPAEPLSPLESHLAGVDALERAQGAPASGEAFAAARRARVEAETRRISEEVTRRAQARRLAEARRQAQLREPPAPSRGGGTSPAATEVSQVYDPFVLEFGRYRLPKSFAFERILVPLDGSERAEQAIPVAARIASASLGEVLLTQVVSVPVSAGIGVPGTGEALEASLDVAIDYLRQVAHSDELVDVDVHKKVLTGASAAATLLEAIELYDADLVVICSHGRTGLARLALGSVARQIARHSPVPVLVLPSESTLASREPRAGDVGDVGDVGVRALVPLDGSALAEAALLPTARLVAALAGRQPGALQLLRVVEVADEQMTPILPYRDPLEVAMEHARTYLQTIAERFAQGELATLGLRVSWSLVEGTDSAQVILDEAISDAQGVKGDGGAAGYDVIGMGTHGRTGLRRLALGSVAERVLEGSRLPLLIVRA